MITVKRSGPRPKGARTWVFQGSGERVGNRKPGEATYRMETDGPWGPAKDRALAGAREFFGVTADVILEVYP